jgi:phosphoglycolate phosphatase
VLTNKPLAPTTSILSALGLSKHFHGRVLGGDGPSPRKPDPAGLCSLIERAAVPARDTLMVGDSVIDWRTAHAAHAKSCIARYGFGFAGFPLEEASVDDSFIDRPGEVLSLL